MTKFVASLAAATVLLTAPAFAAGSAKVGHTTTAAVAHKHHHKIHKTAAKKMVKHTKAAKSSKMKAMKMKAGK